MLDRVLNCFFFEPDYIPFIYIYIKVALKLLGCLLSVFIKIDFLIHFVVERKSKRELLLIEKFVLSCTQIFL